MHRVLPPLTCLLVVLGLSACEQRTPGVDPWVVRVEQCDNALQRARVWLDGLVVDPVKLAQRGLDGRAKLDEVVEAYAVLRDATTDAAESAAIRMRLEALDEHTTTPEYARLEVAPPLPDTSKKDAETLSKHYRLDQLSREDSYRLTRQAGMRGLPGADVEYLRRILPRLSRRCMAEGDVDLLAEVLRSMSRLGLHDNPEYAAIVDYLLLRQNADGSWGSYERDRGVWGAFVVQQKYLPTTLVVCSALTEVFDRRRNRLSGGDPVRFE